AVLDASRHLALPRRLLGDTSRRAADVEGAQRELRPGLADRLRGDDAARLADVHHRHRGQVAAVAHPAETALRLAREDAADLHRLQAGVLDVLCRLLVDELTGLGEHVRTTRLVGLVRILDVLGRDV